MPLDKSRPYPIRPRLSDPRAYIGKRKYFITIISFQRRKIFVRPDIVRDLVAHLRNISLQEKFDIMVYCFMPDHLHIALSGTDVYSDLEKFVKQFKQITGYFLKKQIGHRIWAHSYYDSVLENDDHMRSVVTYTFLNPVRAGIVTSPTEYPFLGSFTFNVEDILKNIM